MTERIMDMPDDILNKRASTYTTTVLGLLHKVGSLAGEQQKPDAERLALVRMYHDHFSGGIHPQ
jgi:hypothetical protein